MELYGVLGVTKAADYAEVRASFVFWMPVASICARNGELERHAWRNSCVYKVQLCNVNVRLAESCCYCM